jgi:hypothetical protein
MQPKENMIPKKLKIGGFDWTVEEVEGLSSDENVFGKTNQRKLLIEIEKTATESKKEHTLLHEIMHACWWYSGLYDRSEPSEEEIISTMSFMLFQVLHDNKLTI